MNSIRFTSITVERSCRQQTGYVGRASIEQDKKDSIPGKSEYHLIELIKRSVRLNNLYGRVDVVVQLGFGTNKIVSGSTSTVFESSSMSPISIPFSLTRKSLQ